MGYVQTSSKKIVRGCKSTYKRNGTLNLFAALNVATGEVKGKTTDTKKREDFQSFMNDILLDINKDKEVHVILDNYATHKRNEDWLKENPNVTFHFTPTSASWLNLNSHIFTHESLPQEYHSQKAQKSVFAFS